MRLLRRSMIAFVILVLCVLIALLVFHRDGSIRTEITIRCSPEQVWKVLTATADYPAWNPEISRLTGELREGNVIEFTAGTGPDGMTFHPTILSVKAAEELRWKGSVLVPGLFDGEHRFLLERQGNQTLFIQSEEFTGLFVGKLTQGVLTETTEQMDAMNSALKQRCELRTAGGPGW
jgi:hypothetical protein